MSKNRQVRQAQSIEDLEKEIKADEEAERKAAEDAAKAGAGTPGSEPDPAGGTPPATPAGEQAPDVAEVADLKAKLQAANDRVAELTKRVNDEDGRRGGELNALRHQVEQLGNQMRDIMAENKALKDAKPAAPTEQPKPEEPDYLRKEFPEIADGVDARTGKALTAAEKAAKAAEDAKKSVEQIQAERARDEEARFFTKLTEAVPNWEEINTSPEFVSFLGNRIPGTAVTRLDALRSNRAALNVQPVIEVFSEYAASKNGGGDKPKPKPKPDPAGQQTPAGAGATGGKVPDKGAGTRARLRELNDKIFVRGTATKDEREEYERLVDADEEGKLT